MKHFFRRNFALAIGILLLWFTGCPNPEMPASDKPITLLAISGVTVPAKGATPVTKVIETAQYTGNITWSPTTTLFAEATVYTANIQLKAKKGWTLKGVAVNSFTVTGATVTNEVNSGVISALFPATEATETSDIPVVPSTDITVTYFKNGGTSGTVPIDNTSYTINSNVNVLANSGGLELSGYSFAGWNTQSNGSGISYATDATFTISASQNLYAVWIPSNLIFSSSGTNIRIEGYYSSPSGTLIIPGGVTSIDNRAFSNCSALTGVSLPDSLLTIGDEAFGYSGLTSIVIPAKVSSIGDTAFAGCNFTTISVDPTNLNYLTDSSGVLYNIDKTFLVIAPKSMTGLYAIPEGVKKLGAYSFSQCDDLTGVTLPSTLEEIGSGTFNNTRGLTSITLPNGLKTIGGWAFAATGLTSILIPAGVDSIGYAAFAYTDIQNIAVEPTSLYFKTDSEGVLFNKAGTILIEAPHWNELKNYTIPDGVNIIGNAAFAGFFDNLSGIIIPEGVTIIEYNAFMENGAVSIILPESLTRIEGGAFSSGLHLTSVTILATTPPFMAPGNLAFENEPAGFKIHVPASPGDVVLNNYKTAMGWSDYESKIVSP